MTRTATRTARTATAPAKGKATTAPAKGKGKGKVDTLLPITDGGTLSRLEDGRLILTGLPYQVAGVGRTWMIMGGKGLGWTYDKSAKGWTSANAGAASEMLATLAEKSIHVVDNRKGKATTATAPATATTARTATAPAKGKATTAPAKGATLADVIRQRLEGTDIPSEVLAEIITHAEKCASRTARTATATATGTRTARTATAKGKGKGAPVKVDAGAVEVVKAGGTRVYTLPAGVNLKSAATLARKALSAGGFDGTHVKRDVKAGAFIVYADKGKVSAKVDGVILAALAG